MLVDDFGEAFRFYRDELGLEPSFDEPSYASFAAGDASVAIFERAGQAETAELRPTGDSALLVLDVDDVDVARLGDRVVGPPVDRPDWADGSHTSGILRGT
jgi:catechol 2,3-dioxygenase-like lactoylglutathione lyase family enzyme